MAQFLATNMGLIQSPVGNLLQQCHQKYDQNPTFSVGLGWILSKSNDAKLIWHNGGTGGFRSYLGFNPKNQRGVVILLNSAEDWPDELGCLSCVVWNDQEKSTLAPEKGDLDPPTEAYSSGGLYSTVEDLQILSNQQITNIKKDGIVGQKEGVKVEKDPRRDFDFRNNSLV